MWWRDYFQTLFQKIKIENISGSTGEISVQFFAIVCPSQGLSKYIETMVRTTGFFSGKSFSKSKKNLELVALSDFLHDFSRKIFLSLHPVNWPNAIVWLSLVREILGNICTIIVFSPVCDVINVEISLIFQIKLFFSK